MAVLLSLSVALTGCGKSSTGNTDNDDILKGMREATVMITVGEYHGSGVIIGLDDEKLTIVTVAHLMEGFDQGIISFFSGKVGFADVSDIYPGKDLCFLTIKRTDMTEDFIETLTTAAYDLDRYEALTRGDKVYITGSAVSVAANISEGTFVSRDYYVADFDMDMMFLYAAVMEGMSGSGVYDSDGYLVGILAGGSDADEAVCVSLKDIIDLWR